MTDIIHAHNLLELLLQSDGGITKDALLSEITDRFGDTVQFTNCTENTHTFDQILQFLASRDKIIVKGDTISACKENICADD